MEKQHLSRRKFIKTATTTGIALGTAAAVTTSTAHHEHGGNSGNQEFDKILELAGSEFGDLKKSG